MCTGILKMIQKSNAEYSTQDESQFFLKKVKFKTEKEFSPFFENFDREFDLEIGHMETFVNVSNKVDK